MKKFLALILSLTLVLSISVPASAAETPAPVTPRAIKPPTDVHITPYTATITNLDAGYSTYTKYYFAPTGEDLEVYGVFYLNDDSDRTVNYRVKICLFKVGASENEDSYTTNYFPSTTGSDSIGFTHTFRNLDPEAKYYFRFDNITAKESGTNRTVMGDVYIE